MSSGQIHGARPGLGAVDQRISTGQECAGEPGVNLLHLARFRHRAYQLLGAMLLYPEESIVWAAPGAARRLRRMSPWAAKLAFYGPLEQFLRRIESLTPPETQELQESYRTLFGNGTPRRSIPLCESAYLDPALLASGWVMADLERGYAAEGLSTSPTRGEASDHAAVELEFVSFLCAQEARAWRAGGAPAVLELVSRQNEFLEQHPGRWFPLLARAVARRDEFGFYTYTVEAARAIAVHDADFLGILVKHLSTETGDIHQKEEGLGSTRQLGRP